jgi:Flp pilus assembly protein TadG
MTLELAILFPVVLLLMFTVVQLALHFHARNIAHAAASEAVIAGSTTTGTVGDASAAGQGFIDRAGSGLLLEAEVQVERTPSTVTVTVRGRSAAVVPAFPLPWIEQTVSGPLEEQG